ncbi:efflux RND transporter permease subunit [Candidatus Chlorohelix sp.]|uniref:efflux RND transporter permease subunit n=1 Tax=Candidatus Chlorohelix sp. TaxID=3139201 RepID=UPI00306A8811
MTALTNWVLKRKSATILITLIVLLFGIFSLTQLKSELLPNIDLPYLTITTVYAGAAPADVLEQVSKPIEQVVGSTQHIKSVRSTSTESFSIVIAEFEFGTNLKDIQQTLNTQFRTLSLPTDLRGQTLQPTVSELSFASQPVVYMGVEALKGQTTEELGLIARGQLKPAISGLTGVSSVQITGDVLKEVRLTVKADQLKQRGLTQTDITNALKGFNVSFPAGTVSLEQKDVSIRTTFTFGSLDDLKNLVIAPAATATTATSAKLSDVADVALVDAPSSSISRTNGNPGLLVQVYKTQNGNTVDVVDAVQKKVDELNQSLSGSVKVSTIYEQASAIKQSIDGLVREGLLGAFFAILVIFLFLRNVRSTLVTAISIPTSIVVALLLLWTQAITLNIMTLGALAIAVGRVVDDAIVVLENIFRHVQERPNEPISVAVKTGTREVTNAITSSTLTTVAVFLPLGFVGGITGQFFLPFALTVTFALLASLVVALTVVPVFASYFINHKAVGTHDEKQDTWIQKIYTPVLRWSLKNRWKTLLIAFLLFITGNVLVTQVPVAFIGSSGDKLLNVTLSMPPGSDQVSTLAKVEELEKTLKADSRVELTESIISGKSSFTRAQSAFSGGGGDATFLLRLNKDANLDAAIKDIQNKMNPLKPQSGNIKVASLTSFSSGFSMVVQGPDEESVRKGSDLVLNKIKDISELTNLSSDVSAVVPQIVVKPNVAATSGRVSTQTLGYLLSSALQPTTVTSIRFDNGTANNVVIYPPDLNGQTIDQWLESLKAIPAAGNSTFGQIATFTRVEAPVKATRLGQKPTASISAALVGDNTGGVTKEVQKRLSDVTLPAGVTYTLTGVSQQQGDAFIGLLAAMGVAIATVYIIMVIAFGSLLEPFVILFSLPLATIGAFTALFITHRALGLPAMIGLLMLIGIVVTNAIVLIDKVNQLHRDGKEKNEALIEAGRNRVRPILMTAVATILALLPLALGMSEGSIIAAELGTVVIGGLVTSTALTLVVVPVIYSLLIGLKDRLTGRGKKGENIEEEQEQVWTVSSTI